MFVQRNGNIIVKYNKTTRNPNTKQQDINIMSSEIVTYQAKGSEDLKNKLLPNDVSDIAKAFGHSYTKVYNWISGRNFGDGKVIEAAKELAKLYVDADVLEKRKQILDKYKSQ